MTDPVREAFCGEAPNNERRGVEGHATAGYADSTGIAESCNADSLKAAKPVSSPVVSHPSSSTLTSHQATLSPVASSASSWAKCLITSIKSFHLC